MWLERKITEILEIYNVKFSSGITRKEYAKYLTNKLKLSRINNRLNKEEFLNKIEHVINDCVEYEYMKDEDGKMVVTNIGRDLLTKLGFLEAYLKRRKRTIMGFLFGFGGIVLGYLLNNLW